jgi:hypothetical protein
VRLDPPAHHRVPAVRGRVEHERAAAVDDRLPTRPAPLRSLPIDWIYGGLFAGAAVFLLIGAVLLTATVRRTGSAT